jgi:TonB-linked SusC/RagA family outer membrane protein
MNKLLQYGHSCCLVFLIFVLLSPILTLAQSNKKITLVKDNIAITDVFKEIKKQTGLMVFYGNQLIDDRTTVNANFVNSAIGDVLKTVLAGKNLTWEIQDQFIVLKKNVTGTVGKTTNDTAKPPVTITGQVLDEKGLPIPGTNIRVKDGTTVVQTNSSGEFSIPVSNPTSAVLVVTFIGYTQREVVVGNETRLIIRLTPENTGLNEVVVIGFGTVSRKDVTGSISSVDARQLRDMPINSAAQALTGRLAGVQATSSEGAPNSDVKVVIRGGGSVTQDNSPLYIIDGVQVENGLNGISPQDIASIDVLKDASSTAIYGARGANGVVIVTTKGGRNMKTAVSYNALFGVNLLANKLKVLSPYDYVVYQYERSRGNGTDSISFKNNYGGSFDSLSVYKSRKAIDWQDEVFGKKALIQTHNLSITGGDAKTTFNISLTKNLEDGIMKGSDFDRNLANMRFDHSVNSKLKIGLNFRYANQTVNGSGTSANGSTQNSYLKNAIKYRPFLVNPNLGISDFDPDYYNQTAGVGNGVFIINPLELVQAQYRRNNTKIYNINGYVNYTFTPFLSFKSTAGLDYNIQHNDAFDDSVSPNAIYGGGSSLPLISVTDNSQNTLNVSNVFTFTNSSLKGTFNKNNAINFLLGQEIYQLDNRLVNIRLRYFPAGITADKALGQYNLGTSFPGYPSSALNASRIASFFTRLNYSFRQKYLASFTLRADGSTKFKEGKQWGYFPSGSLAWRISEEHFIKQLEAVSDLKLRLSYGRAGNNRIGDFLYATLYNTNSNPYGLNDQLVSGYSVTKLANPNLKWETTVSKNIGLDLGLWNNRVSLTVDAYQNDTHDLLINVPIPSTSGYTTQLQNVGSTRNTGLEFQLSGSPIANNKFRWNVNFNISFNRNKILALSQYQGYYYQNSGWGISGQLPDYIVKVGQPVGSMYGFVTDGYYKLSDFDYDPATRIYKLKSGVADNSAVLGVVQPGGLKFKDIDGDGKVDADHDRTVIGDANPKFTGGLFQQFTYKNFDLSVFLNFVYGNSILNANKIDFTSSYTGGTNMLGFEAGRWRTIDNNGNVIQQVITRSGQQVVVGASPDVLGQVNANATIWQPLRNANSYVLHSWAVEDGSFLRVNNITMGYTFKNSLFQKAKIKNLRVYATVNNVALITGYSGYDPEVNISRSTPVTPGLDYSAYPRSRSFIFGLNLNF